MKTMHICACCNPPEVVEDMIIGGQVLPANKVNGITIPSVPTTEARGRKVITEEGVTMLEKTGYIFKLWKDADQKWWHKPNGEPVEGMIDL